MGNRDYMARAKANRNMFKSNFKTAAEVRKEEKEQEERIARRRETAAEAYRNRMVQSSPVFTPAQTNTAPAKYEKTASSAERYAAERGNRWSSDVYNNKGMMPKTATSKDVGVTSSPSRQRIAKDAEDTEMLDRIIEAKENKDTSVENAYLVDKYKKSKGYTAASPRTKEYEAEYKKNEAEIKRLETAIKNPAPRSPLDRSNSMSEAPTDTLRDDMQNGTLDDKEKMAERRDKLISRNKEIEKELNADWGEEQLNKDIEARRKDYNIKKKQEFWDQWGAEYYALPDEDREAFETVAKNEGHSAYDKAKDWISGNKETKDAKNYLSGKYTDEQMKAFSQFAKDKVDYETNEAQEKAYNEAMAKIARMSDEDKETLASLGGRAGESTTEALRKSGIQYLADKYGLDADETEALAILQKWEQNKIDTEEYNKAIKPFLKKHPWLAWAATSANNLAGVFYMTGQLRDASDAQRLKELGYEGKIQSQAENNPLSAAYNLNTLNQEVNGDRTGGWYNRTNQIASNILMNLSGAVPSALMFFSSGYASGVNEATANGTDFEHAQLTGASQGINEMLFEKLSWGSLGAVENFTGGALKSSGIARSLMEWLPKIALDMGINGLEEVNTDIANDIADYLINGDFSKYALEARSLLEEGYSQDEVNSIIGKEIAKSYAETFKEGALQGAIMAGAYKALGEVKARNIGKQAQKYGYTRDIIENAEAAGESAKQYKDEVIAQEGGDKNLSPAQIGRIVQETQKTLAESETARENLKKYQEQYKETRNEALDRALERVKSSGITDEGVRNSFHDSYSGGDMETYARNFANAAQLASTGLSERDYVNKLESLEMLDGMGAHAIQAAYASGLNSTISKSGAHMFATMDAVRSKEKRRAISSMVSLVDEFGKQRGLSFTFVDTINDKNGFYRNKTGSNQIVISLDAEGTEATDIKGIKPERNIPAILRTVAHETFHWLEQYDKDNDATLSSELKDFIVGYYENVKGKEWLNDTLEKNYPASTYKTEEARISEFVADNLFSAFASDRAVNELVSKNENLAKRVKRHIGEAITFFRNAIKKMEAKGIYQEISEMQKNLEMLDEINNRFFDALNKATGREARSEQKSLDTILENKQRVQEATKPAELLKGKQVQTEEEERFSTRRNRLADNGIEITDDNTARFSSIRAFAKFDENGEFVIDKAKVMECAEDMSTATGIPYKKCLKYLKDNLSLTALVLQDREHLEYEADDFYSAFKSNSEYWWGAIDFNTNCPKRKSFTEIYDRLQQKWNKRSFDQWDLAIIRNVLQDSGIQVACGLCFVEDRRQQLGKIATDYISMVKASQKTGETLTKKNSSGKLTPLHVTEKLAEQWGDILGVKKNDQLIITDDYVPTQYDLGTYEGFRALRENHPQIAMGYIAYNNSRGQASGRLIEGTAEYKRQILDLTQKQVDTINNNGGLRIFSFSDFEAPHTIDLIQIIEDCATKGIKIQAYTKQPAFARMVKDTNLKLNLSRIPSGIGYREVARGFKNAVEHNGKYYELTFDNVEGINKDVDNYIDTNKNDNIGNVLVGINETQIRLAMKSKMIDFIIPFHTNQRRAVLAVKGVSKKWVNYKKTQNERVKSTGKNAKTNVNIYTDVIQKHGISNEAARAKGMTAERMFTEAFLQECAEKGLTPRFAEFLDKGDIGGYGYTEGYYKFLVDYKLFNQNGEMLEQKVVVPKFDLGYVREMIEAQRDSSNAFEVEKPKRDAAVNEIDALIRSGAMNEGGALRKQVQEAAKNRKVDEIPSVRDMVSSTKREAEYAPTFYSQMGKVIDGVKQDKLSTNGLINMLKGKGVKDEEIQWSGIEEWLADKGKSVTKKELQEFIQNSMLNIEQVTLDNAPEFHIEDTEDGGFNVVSKTGESIHFFYSEEKDAYISTESDDEFADAQDALETFTDPYIFEDNPDGTRWHGYKTEGGSNYREVLFTLPSSGYKNFAMNTHWERPGVLAHARIQDMLDEDNNRMLFVDEIQSDWHNQLEKDKSTISKQTIANRMQQVEKDFAESKAAKPIIEKVITVYPHSADLVTTMLLDINMRPNLLDGMSKHGVTFNDEEISTIDSFGERYSKLQEEWLKAPTNWEAAPDAPFKNGKYVDYVLKNLLRMAAENGYDKLAWTPAEMQSKRWSDEFAEGYRIEYDQDIPKFLNKFGKKFGAKVGESYIMSEDEPVWSMDITPEMKDSVLYEGQPLYSTKRDAEYFDAIKKYGEDSKEVAKMTERAAFEWGAFSDYKAETPIDFYHGTPNGGFTVFGGTKTRNGADAAGSYWFTENDREHAGVYRSYPGDAKTAENPMTYKVWIKAGNYADIGNGRVMALDYERDGAGAATKELKAVAKAIAFKTMYNYQVKSGKWLGMDEIEKVERRRANQIAKQLTEIARDISADFIWQVTETKEFADLCVNEGLDGVIAWEQDKGYNGTEPRMVKTYGVFNRNDIKSADPVTYDSEGNIIPLSERFNSENEDIRYSSKRDSDGNQLTTEQESFFEKSKIRDENGNLLVVYHGTDEDFTVFDKTKGRSTMDIQGMFFSPWEIDAGGYGKNVGKYYLNITNPAPEDVAYKALNMYKGQNNAGVKAREYLEKLGYDGVNNGNEEYIAFNSNQIKRVDNLNPTENEDTRYSTRRDIGYEAEQTLNNATEEEMKQIVDAVDKELLGDAMGYGRMLGEQKRKTEQKVKEQRRKDVEYYHQRMKEIRADRDQKLMALKMLQYQKEVERKEFSKRQDYKGRIIRKYEKLQKMLLHPTENQHVPADLVHSIADFLEYITPNFLQEQYRKDGTTIKKREKNNNRLMDLVYAYGKIKEEYEDVYDEDVHKLLQEASDTFGKKTIDEMDSYELSDINNLLGAIEHTIRQQNKITIEGRERSAAESAKKWIRQITNARGRHKSTPKDANERYKETPLDKVRGVMSAYWEVNLDPTRVLRTFDQFRKDGVGQQLAERLNKAKNKARDILYEIDDHFQHLTDDTKQLDKLRSYKKEDLVDIGLKGYGNQPVLITRGMMLHVYKDLMNEDNTRHLVMGGYTVPNLSEYYKGNKKVGVRVKGLGDRLYDLNKQLATLEDDGKKNTEQYERILSERDELYAESGVYAEQMKARIESLLTDYEREWLKEAKWLCDDYGKEKLNEASMYRYGFRRATEDNYFHISTDKSLRKQKESETESQAKAFNLENSGFMKERVKGAANPIWLTDITEDMREQAQRVADYSALMPAIWDFNKVYGRTTRIINTVKITELKDNSQTKKADIDRDSIIAGALESVRKLGGTNKKGHAYVRVDSIKTDVAVSKASIRHGLDRRAARQKTAYMNIGSILKNSIKIADLEPKNADAKKTYTLVGAGRTEDGRFVIVKFLVNNFSNDVEEYDLLYSADTKKEPAGLSPRASANALSLTGSDISISSLIEYVNRISPGWLQEGERVYNSETRLTSVRDAIQSVWGDKGTRYIDKMLDDLSGAKTTKSAVSKVIGKFRGLAAQAMLTINPRVALAQAASYPTAGSELGWKPLMKALRHGGKNNTVFSRADRELIKKYTSALEDRYKGVEKTSLSNIRENSAIDKRILKKTAPLTNWIQKIDEATVGRLWYASEYYVDDKFKDLEKGTDEYYQKVAEVFESVVEKTQPNFSDVMHRSALLRSDNDLLKLTTMFMTQRSQNLNILYDSVMSYHTLRTDLKNGATDVTQEEVEEAGKAMWRALSSQIAASITLGVMKVAVDLGQHNLKRYRDDDDEVTMLAILGNLLDTVLECLVSNFYLANEIYSFAESAITGQTYYGMQLNLTSTLEDFTKDLANLTKGIEGNKVYRMVKDLCTLTGLPAAQVEKWVNMVRGWANDIANGEFDSQD